jgi:uncharacterized membrane protein YhaH (DUF805 family)
LRRLFLDYSGRTNRLAFAGACGVWFAALTVGVILTSILERIARDAGYPLPSETMLLLAAIHTAGILPLQTRRLRSMGVAQPLAWVLGVLSFSVFDYYVLAKLTWLRMAWPYGFLTPVGGVVQLTLALLLFLWPAARLRPKPAQLAETFA